MKQDTKLYNVLFPIWLLWLWPSTWLVVLPLNFIIDGLVIWLTMRVLKLTGRKEVLKKALWKTWLFGFLADFIGTALMFSVNWIDFALQDSPVWQWWYEHLTNGVSFNPFDNPFAFLFVLLCVVVSGLFIYLFNQKFALRKAVPDLHTRRKLSLSLAIFTAPYLFFFPSMLLYR